MIYILIGTLLSTLLAYSLIKEYLDMRKKTIALVRQHNDYLFHNHSLSMQLLVLVAIAMGIATAIIGFSTGDDLNVTLGIAVVILFIGQYFNSLYRTRFFCNDTSLITCGKLIRYKSVKKINTSRSLFQKRYTVQTFNGDQIVVSQKTADYLKTKI